jgi:hypothetical protein
MDAYSDSFEYLTDSFSELEDELDFVEKEAETNIIGGVSNNCLTLSVQVRMATLLTIFVHSALICGPIGSKPSANERIKFEIK